MKLILIVYFSIFMFFTNTFGESKKITNSFSMMKPTEVILSPSVSVERKLKLIDSFKKSNLKLTSRQKKKLILYLPQCDLRLAVSLGYFLVNTCNDDYTSNLNNSLFLTAIKYLKQFEKSSEISKINAKNLVDLIYLFDNTKDAQTQLTKAIAVSEICLEVLKKDKSKIFLKSFFPQNKISNFNNIYIRSPYFTLFAKQGQTLFTQNNDEYVDFLLYNLANNYKSNTTFDILNLFLAYSDYLYRIPVSKIPIFVDLSRYKVPKVNKASKKILEKLFHTRSRNWEEWWRKNGNNFNFQNYLSSLIFNRNKNLLDRRKAVSHLFGLTQKEPLNLKRYIDFVYDMKQAPELRMDIGMALCDVLKRNEALEIVRKLYSEPKMQIVAMSIISLHDFYDNSLYKKIFDDLLRLDNKPDTFLKYAVMALRNSKNKRAIAKRYLKLLHSKKLSESDRRILFNALRKILKKNYPTTDIKTWEKAIEALPEDEKSESVTP